MYIQGSCHCGSVTVATEREAVEGIIRCYCRDCQQHLGNFAPWVVCGKEVTRVTGPIGEYDISSASHRLYCTACGSTIGKRPKDGEKILFAAGIFDQPLDIMVIKEVFVQSKQPWMLHVEQ